MSGAPKKQEKPVAKVDKIPVVVVVVAETKPTTQAAATKANAKKLFNQYYMVSAFERVHFFYVIGSRISIWRLLCHSLVRL